MKFNYVRIHRVLIYVHYYVLFVSYGRFRAKAYVLLKSKVNMLLFAFIIFQVHNKFFHSLTYTKRFRLSHEFLHVWLKATMLRIFFMVYSHVQYLLDNKFSL